MRSGSVDIFEDQALILCGTLNEFGVDVGVVLTLEVLDCANQFPDLTS